MKTKTLFIVITSFVSILMFAGSCTNDVAEELYPIEPIDTTGLDSLSYNADTKIIFDTKCAISGCHDNVTKEAGVDLSSFAGVNAKIDKIEETVFVIMSMPKSGSLSTEERQKLRTWIDNGAPEN